MTNDELINYLIDSGESEFVEFKENNYEINTVGERVSALANGAVLERKDEAYLVYGVSDAHEIVGTTLNISAHTSSNIPFKNHLSTNLDHAGNLEYITAERDGKRIVVIVIPRATAYPVKWRGVEYIRVGSSKKKLSEHPEVARKLWEEILKVTFEEGHASDLVDRDVVLQQLDFSPYFTLREAPEITNPDELINLMTNEGVIVPKLGKYYITNLGALLYARDFSNYESLLNRGVRLIKYVGNDKTVVERSIETSIGYAVSVASLLNDTMLLLPSEEYFDGETRKTKTIFPRKSIRELLINMVMHQDFSISGYAPRIEIYSDRVEFTNPGAPVIPVERFLDTNMSRNPKLARLMRFMLMSEERGMGIDTVETLCEANFLPSPSITSNDGFTRITIFSHKSLRQFNSIDRTNLVYMHCSLQFVKHQETTNESLRSRFPESTLSSTVASRWINETIEKGLIRPFDPDSHSRRHAKYVPIWA